MKIIKKLVLILIIIIIGIFIFSTIQYSPLYMKRVIFYRESDILDYKIFPDKVIKKSETPFIFENAIDKLISDLKIDYDYNKKQYTNTLDILLNDTGTTSFIILKNNNLIFENYYNGYSRESINTSFSATKSIVSLLIGIAIDDGFIKSENESIANYIDEFKNTEFEKITIKELLNMRSPIKYKEGNLWFGDDSKTYYSPDLRKLALQGIEINSEYDGKFHYNNYHPLLLGIILERSTNKAVSEYFEEKIWSQIGTEYNASWSLDSDTSSFEKMESGINFRSIDFIKIGSVLINNSLESHKQIIPTEWVSKSIKTGFPFNKSEYKGTFLEDKDTAYQYMWYSTQNDKGGYDYYAAGKYGQILYISPDNNIVILRTGKANGKVDWWPDILRNIVNILSTEKY